jgi:hypothetical protein
MVLAAVHARARRMGFQIRAGRNIIQPEHYGVLVVLPLLLAALGLSLRSSPRGR